MSAKIIICTTFRDFKGNDNDKIQELFLDSLENQDYKDFDLVVTLFGEKKVESVVRKRKLKSFFYDCDPGAFRYCLSKVVLNAISYSKSTKEENYIILWTTCDVILDKNFLSTIISNFRKNILGTSHPHLTYGSVTNYDNRRPTGKIELFSGFDLIFFDKDFLFDKKIMDAINNNIFNDWGIFEHFLISLTDLSRGTKRINLFETAKIYKIENDRKLTNEPNVFLEKSHIRNSAVFRKFLITNKLSIDYFDLVFCHLRFKLTRNFLRHFIFFASDIFSFYYRRIASSIAKSLPIPIKKFIKRIL